MAKKNITINQLAEKMDKGFDDFGIMVKQGFDDAQQGMNKRFNEVDNRLENIDKKIAELRRDMEEVKLKFAYTAWAIDVEELKKRVIVLEKKLSIK